MSWRSSPHDPREAGGARPDGAERVGLAALDEALRLLSREHRVLAARRALALVLSRAAVMLAALALAALLTRYDLLRAASWGPLALWLTGALVAASAVIGSRRLFSAPDAAAMRQTASLVEGEQRLRRGTLAGLVDLAHGVPEGTSADLAFRAAGETARVLPPYGLAPAVERELARLVRRRAAQLGGAAVFATLAVWYAGEAASLLASPLSAARSLVAPRISISVSSRRIPAGGEVTVIVDAGTSGHPSLHVRATGESWREVALDPGPDGRASRLLSDIRTSLFLYASAGPATSDTVRVAVVEPPFVTSLELTARYPAYLERPEEPLAAGDGPLALPVGTVVLISGTASSPLSRASLVRRPSTGLARDTSAHRAREAAGGEDGMPLRVSGPRFSGELQVRGSATWTLAATDRGGMGLSEPVPSLQVVALPDSAPVVSVPVPGTDTTAPIDLRPVLVVDAGDDHGLDRVEIVSWRVSRLGVIGDTVVDTLAGVSGADRVVQSRELDLTARGLLPGDTLRFFARARDRAAPANVGASREYALRLRSMAELREAVRAAADTLARDAAALAVDQSVLSRRTEDLAAQRNRTADPSPQRRDGREVRQETQRAVPFEQAEEAGRVAERQRELAERAMELRDELQRLARAAEEAGLTDPAWRERLAQLEDLLREAITPELRQRLDELRQALERLDPRAVQEALRNLVTEQARLRRELERSAELFERAALEGALQTYAAQLEAMRRAEEQWAARAEARRDSAAAAAEQRQLASEVDSLRRGLERLSDRLVQRGDSAAARELRESTRELEEAEGDIEAAADAMERGARAEAGREATSAAQRLSPLAERLRRQQQEMAAAWRLEVLRMMDLAVSETIALAAEEERMAGELRRGEGSAEARGRQSAVEQGIERVVRRLQQAAGRHALVSPRLGAALGQARENVAQSRQSLEGTSPQPLDAAEQAEAAAEALSAAAFLLLRNREQVAGAQSGSGFAEAVERLARLAGQQGQLNDQLGGLIPLLGSGEEAVMAQLRELAARQRALANELERMGGMGLPGRPEQLAEEARQLADRMEQGRLDRGTIERQQRLFRRMLDAGRTLRNEDEDQEPERRSETARERGEGELRAPRGAMPAGSALRYPVPGWELLKGLSAAERAMVLDYFRRINAQR
jgi:hypothetical protein